MYYIFWSKYFAVATSECNCRSLELLLNTNNNNNTESKTSRIQYRFAQCLQILSDDIFVQWRDQKCNMFDSTECENENRLSMMRDISASMNKKQIQCSINSMRVAYPTPFGKREREKCKLSSSSVCSSPEIKVHWLQHFENMQP